jgi:hypothetical protein
MPTNKTHDYIGYCNSRTAHLNSAFKIVNGKCMQYIDGKWQPEIKPMETPRLPKCNPDGTKII